MASCFVHKRKRTDICEAFIKSHFCAQLSFTFFHDNNVGRSVARRSSGFLAALTAAVALLTKICTKSICINYSLQETKEMFFFVPLEIALYTLKAE